MQREMFYDRKLNASLEAAGQAPEGGTGGGGLGGDTGRWFTLGGDTGG